MIYILTLIAAIGVSIAVDQYFNNKTPFNAITITSGLIGLVFYVLSFIFVQMTWVDNTNALHESILVTLFVFALFWVLSHRNSTYDTIFYTIAIVLLTIALAVINVTQPSLTMLIVRIIFTVIFLGQGIYVVYKQVKDKVSESFPLLYLLAFVYWVSVAYGF
ncbi:hypothetical protein [Staphylococcus auricularis]|uniref:Transmembrane protein n=1 Tax=Staphylococcus auricularis TaxID=29379 RepID=A0ABX5IGQ6_9STAP|nr:hypothetical protein [Staphylococcus auricularis]MCE5038636.1 hypothetical protein [Staphylococcus auricularis]MEB6570123.1 hypothetical protein [Staphylococcus auricularis]PTH19369.1 hypothetical protein BU607_02130 [Staphylococcus auricularis]PTH26426.1 hypothetical protein BU608_04260 [Staphylococcus auricularis]